MKILAKVRAFSGGAALSLLEYLKALKDMDNEITVMTEFTDNGIQEKYKNENYTLINASALNHINIISKIKYLFKGYNIIKQGDYDLLIVITGVDTFFYSSIAEIINIPILIILAGGKITEGNHKISRWGSNPLICFSRENYADLKRLNYDISKVYQISNRIDISNNNCSFDNYINFGKKEKIRLLIISRIDTSKINSIKHIIKLTNYLFDRGYRVELQIAGDGLLYETIDNEINEINIKANCIVVKKLGFVKEVSDIIPDAHIVFGKGRSVIEAIMMNRIGVVVNEDDEMCICSKESRDNLTENNFAGRHLLYTNTFADIEFLINQMQNKTINYEEIEALAQMVKKDYSSEYLVEKLEKILKDEFTEISQKKEKRTCVFDKFKIISRVIVYYILTVKNYAFRFFGVKK